MHIYIPFYIDIDFIVIISIFSFIYAYRRSLYLEQLGCAMSKPSYFAWWSCIVVFLPSLLLALMLNSFIGLYGKHEMQVHLTAQKSDLSVQSRMQTIQEIIAHPKLLMQAEPVLAHSSSKEAYDNFSDIYSKANINLPLSGDISIVKTAFYWQKLKEKFSCFRSLLVLLAAISLCFFAQKQVRPSLRVRSKIEAVIYYILQFAAIIAILTTCAIVLSLIFQTFHFFEMVSWRNFFLNLTWNPRFSGGDATNNVGQFGIWPLVVGTIYIALIAMMVAAPIGLLAAIYMCEYAKPNIRTIIKLFLEILAGIPTIVYGFFAILVVGPFLRDISAYLAGGEPFIMAQSVLTAGLVIGIMLIPFVSSLTDDALKAVPQSLRDCSYGLGATQAETIKKVVFPAAIPGIVSALLLSVSRAIGETMIVVLAAGVAPNLTINPFQAMTTITVKIVNQLTGDTEFNSPQTLVAFALGITLFIFTLLLNILALYIVRKYREQYE